MNGTFKASNWSGIWKYCTETGETSFCDRGIACDVERLVPRFAASLLLLQPHTIKSLTAIIHSQLPFHTQGEPFRIIRPHAHLSRDEEARVDPIADGLISRDNNTKLKCPTLRQLQKGPNNHQKKRAPQPAQLESSEGPASDLIDVDSPHISQVHSDFKSQAQQTGTQAERMAKEAEDQARQTSAQAEQKASEASGEAKKKTSEFSKEAEQKTDEFSEDAAKNYEKAKKIVSEDYDKSKKYAGEKYREGREFASETKDELNIKARDTRDDLSANRDNPVVVGNAIVWAIGGVALGVGAYNKHVKGELDWSLVGIAAGAVGVLAVGDYYLSQWLFKNKYPKK